MSDVLTAPGTASAQFAPAADQLAAFAEADPDYSAQLAVYRHGELVVDVAVGADFTTDSLSGIYSVSKGAAAMVLGALATAGDVDFAAPVATYWPEFAAAGKSTVTVSELLSHQAGVVGTLDNLPDGAFLHSSAAAAQLAATRPQWSPGSAFGYHGLTVGVFMEELVRRITGETLQNVFEERVRAPRALDFYLGLPAEMDNRYVPVRNGSDADINLTASRPPWDGYLSLSRNALNRADDLIVSDTSPNLREVRASGFAGAGGVASARGIAGVYAAALGHLGDKLLSDDVIADMSQQRAWGTDRVLEIENAFGIVFMKPTSRMPFGSYRAFGHDGAGGALGFADPQYGISFGYTVSSLPSNDATQPRSIQLSTLVRSLAIGRTD